MKNKLLVIVIAALLLINVQCDDGGDPDPVVRLDVPYHAQEEVNWCGIACIHMWSDYDGFNVTQQDIAWYIGVSPGQPAHPAQLEHGVSQCTCYEGHLAVRLWNEPGAQGDLIAATIAGMDRYIPSIMPFWEDHAVIITGHKWREDEYGRPFAIKTWYHESNPANGGPDVEIPADILAHSFMPCPWEYWVIVAYPELVEKGIEGHNMFVVAGGTYYGGPSYYNPKGLTLDPNLN
jgi:hypothetical protein